MWGYFIPEEWALDSHESGTMWMNPVRDANNDLEATWVNPHPTGCVVHLLRACTLE